MKTYTTHSPNYSTPAMAERLRRRDLWLAPLEKVQPTPPRMTQPAPPPAAKVLNRRKKGEKR